MASSKEAGEIIYIEGPDCQQFKQVENFKYLGSRIDEEKGGTERDVRGKLQAGWNKQKEVSGEVEDRKMNKKLNMKLYKTLICPVLVYGTQT